MKRLLVLLVAGLSWGLTGCFSDCSVAEATGSMQIYAQHGCSSVFSDGLIKVSLYAHQEKTFDEFIFGLSGPYFSGRQGSSGLVGRSTLGSLGDLTGHGFVDWEILDFLPSDREPRISVRIHRATIESSIVEPGVFRGVVNPHWLDFDSL
jgi:hypothetical protein